MEFEYDSGYESNEAEFELADVLAGDHDDIPLDQLLMGMNR